MRRHLSEVIDTLLELARPVSKVEDITTGLYDQVIRHLVKVIRYKDDRNCRKHIKDIKNWLFNMNRKIKKSGSRISLNKLKRWYNVDNIEDEVLGIIVELDNKYLKLPIKVNDKKIIVKNVEDFILHSLHIFSNIKSFEQSAQKIDQISNEFKNKFC